MLGAARGTVACSSLLSLHCSRPCWATRSDVRHHIPTYDDLVVRAEARPPDNDGTAVVIVVISLIVCHIDLLLLLWTSDIPEVKVPLSDGILPHLSRRDLPFLSGVSGLSILRTAQHPTLNLRSIYLGK